MKKSRILTKMLITISLIVVTTSVFAVSVFAYYELLISNTNNVIKAGKYSSNIEVYVVDSTSGILLIDNEEPAADVYATKIQDIEDVIGYIFNVLDDKGYYIKVTKNSNSNINFIGAIDSGSGVPITSDGIVFELLNKGEYKYWTKPINSSIKYETTEVMNLGEPPLLSMVPPMVTVPETQEEEKTEEKQEVKESVVTEENNELKQEENNVVEETEEQTKTQEDDNSLEEQIENKETNDN